MNEAEDLWQRVVLASEADLRGNTQAGDKELLTQYKSIHLAVLKSQKANVEYQFSSHKAVMAELYSKLLAKKLTLSEYTNQRKEQFLWKAKAISYLIRIEEKISQLKISSEKKTNET